VVNYKETIIFALLKACKKTVIENRYQQRWRKKNVHNFTIAGCSFPQENVIVGKATYGEIVAYISNEEYKLSIGNYCSIAPGVKFIVCSDHPTNYISTYPFKVMINGEKCEAISKGDIIVSDDVWIGCNAIILSGVSIGQGAIIAAGAVVTKDVPPYALVGGTPAKIIKYRFNDTLISELIKIDYSKLNYDDIKNNIAKLYENYYSVEQSS